MSAQDWRARAACAGRTGRWWFTTPSADPIGAGVARAICVECPVQRDCAAEALFWLGRERLVGTWAGVDVERRGARLQLAKLAGEAVAPWSKVEP